MTDLDLARLKALAEKATPGKRRVEERGNLPQRFYVVALDRLRTIIAWNGVNDIGAPREIVEKEKDDAEFIAALDPATVLALIRMAESPSIPSPEVLAEVREFLRCVAMPGVDVEKYADGSCGSEEWARWSVAARALLAKLEAAP